MRAKTLSKIELERALATCDPMQAVMVLLSHRAGLRACEIAALDWSMITTASGTSDSTTVTGTINSAAGKTFTIQLYSNTQINPRGFGGGEKFLGTAESLTNSSKCVITC